jgi:hypothetical protein
LNFFGFDTLPTPNPMRIPLVPQGPNLFLIMDTISVRTSQETHDVSATKLNWLILFRETATVYCENYTEQINTLFPSQPVNAV